jgi:sterol desaturase/sphingolipid hydroxylase (fatty acid hydroxylase superfamily)
VLRSIGTSTFHARHHQEPTSNFGFYTSIWDELFRSLNRAYRDRFAQPPA